MEESRFRYPALEKLCVGPLFLSSSILGPIRCYVRFENVSWRSGLCSIPEADFFSAKTICLTVFLTQAIKVLRSQKQMISMVGWYGSWFPFLFGQHYLPLFLQYLEPSRYGESHLEFFLQILESQEKSEHSWTQWSTTSNILLCQNDQLCRIYNQFHMII